MLRFTASGTALMVLASGVEASHNTILDDVMQFDRFEGVKTLMSSLYSQVVHENPKLLEQSTEALVNFIVRSGKVYSDHPRV